MSREKTIAMPGTQAPPTLTPTKQYTSQTGIRMQIGQSGQPEFNMDDVRRVICDEISKLPQHHAGPVVKAAEDARKVIDELLHGIGEEMEKFKADAKLYIDDIRQTRFAVVSEVGQMKSGLSDVRNFLMGPDHDEQIRRLTEFVELCERLNALRNSGFLDRMVDTMLRLNP